MWPPNYNAEFRRRADIIYAMRDDPRARQIGIRHYRANPVDFINDFCITYDPRIKAPKPKLMPFMLFPRQVEFVHYLLYVYTAKCNALVEKARDMGATWLCCAFSIWLWLFHPGSAIGWGSRKELLIDRIGSPDSIFEKMRMILDNMPEFMLPQGFRLSEHAPFMRLINPETGSIIIGEGGDNMGRGGRTGIYFKDESAHYERPELIEAALGDNTDVQVDISSVNGAGNPFYRRRMGGEIWTPGCVIPRNRTAVFIMDWRDHPGKTQEWYDMRRQRAEQEGMLHLFSQEVDRDYSASVDRVIIPAQWVNAAIDAHIKLNFRDDGERTAGLDVADEGGDKNAEAIRCGVVLRFCEDWGEGDTGETARRAVSKALEYRTGELYYDSIGVGAGVKAETNRMKSEGLIPPSLRILPWNAAAAPLNPEDHLIPEDSNSPRNEDFFANLKAQAWWLLAIRFEKTYKAVTQGARYRASELISLDSKLPKLEQLKMELSQARRKYNGKGKLVVDKKPDGTKSPNLADAVVTCYCPTREVSILDVL